MESKKKVAIVAPKPMNAIEDGTGLLTGKISKTNGQKEAPQTGGFLFAFHDGVEVLFHDLVELSVIVSV